MRIPVNRVLLAFSTWEDRKKQMGPLLKSSAADETIVRRLQLDHLRKARHRLSGDVRPDEQPFMLVLSHQIARLEKQQYPNRMLRMFSRLKDRHWDRPLYLRQQQARREANMDHLNEKLKVSGFSYLSGKLDGHLDRESPKAIISLDCQLGAGKQLGIGLHFEKDSYGDFQLSRIDGSLLQEGREPKKQTFDTGEWPNLKSVHVLSLLEGRAVRQAYTDASGQPNQRWVQLGARGIERFGPDHFNLRTALAALPEITRNKEELARYLENGQQVAAHWKHGKHFQNIFVQADPAGRTVSLFDAKQRPVTAEQLNQKGQPMAARQNNIKRTVPEQSRKRGKAAAIS